MSASNNDLPLPSPPALQPPITGPSIHDGDVVATAITSSTSSQTSSSDIIAHIATSQRPPRPPTTTANTTTTSTTTTSLLPKKRKASTTTSSSTSSYYVPSPRVLKTDLRRKYVTMLENVMNQGDFNFMHSFFETFAKPNVMYRGQINDPSIINLQQIPAIHHQISSQIDCNVSITGLDPYFWYFATVQCMSPDITSRLEEVHIHTYAGIKRTQIECNFIHRCTLVYNIQMESLAQEAYMAFVSKTLTDSSTSSTSTSSSSSSAAASSSLLPAANVDIDAMTAVAAQEERLRLETPEAVMKALFFQPQHSYSSSTSILRNNHIKYFPEKSMNDMNEMLNFIDGVMEKKQLVTFPHPIDLVIRGKIILHLDDNKAIELMDQFSQLS